MRIKIVKFNIIYIFLIYFPYCYLKKRKLRTSLPLMSWNLRHSYIFSFTIKSYSMYRQEKVMQKPSITFSYLPKTETRRFTASATTVVGVATLKRKCFSPSEPKVMPSFRITLASSLSKRPSSL